MAKYYFLITIFFYSSLALSDSDTVLNKLIHTNQCIKCDFSNLELKGVKFWRASIMQSNFKKTNLSKSNFQSSNLSNSVFNEALLIGA